MNPAVPPLSRRPFRSLFVLLVSGLLATSAVWAAKGNKDERKDLRREMGMDISGVKAKGRDVAPDPRDRKPSSTDPQNRMLTKLREQLEVVDDDEWDVIAVRIEKLEEVRRGVSSSAPADRTKRTSSNVERDMLRAAVSDKLPEAEIKSRLARAREAYHQNEDRLAAAQADLRAVLSVRQEAITVLAGLLPP
ncbi:MAG: hypothetical protein ABIQ12_10670 [Opitutaceae bacterium]